MWQEANTKLLCIKQTVGKWKKEKFVCRKDQVAVNRLRVGHTAITHEYLMDGEIAQGPPECPLCQQATLTVEHIFRNCESIIDSRRRYFNSEQPRLKDILGDGVITENLFGFLRDINLYDLL